MIKSLHVSLGSASVGCRHLERVPVPDTVSPVCPSLPSVCQRRKRSVRGIGVWSFIAESCCAAGRLVELLHVAGQQEFHIACIQGTQLAFNSEWRLSTASGEPVSGKFFPYRSQVCPFLMAALLRQDLRPSRPVVSKRFTDGSQAAFLGSESKLVKGVLNWICMS